MKVAVNLFLASPKSITGAFVYIQDILPALFANDTGTTYYLVGHADTIAYFKSQYQKYPNVRYRVFDVRRDIYINPFRALMKLIAKLKKDNDLREKIIAKEVQKFFSEERIDVYFSPSSVIYPRNVQGVKNVTTILDLQPEYFPENFSQDYLTERRRDALYATKHSDRLIAISEYTKKTIEEKYGTDPKKIRVIYFAPHEIEDTPIDITLPEDFIFYPAALWPHKNHHVLIKAMGMLKDRFPSLHVVCAGVVKRKELKRELETLIEKEGLQGRISFSGFVSGSNLRMIYTKAKALVFPSAFEGFGIPLVEAFQFGLPVIAADNSSITEVVHGSGILVETGNAAALANAIEKVMTDKNLRNELVQKGHERAKMFSWEAAARETLRVFRD
ncbi:MAG: glycosyltransferase family 1 protein [bacterium]|nr:glycosyltransferase family 1 protein [bacterium]MDO8742392.1 glycosyltransferase family 1 protein [bacterium]